MAKIPFMTEDGRMMIISDDGIGRYVTEKPDSSIGHATSDATHIGGRFYAVDVQLSPISPVYMAPALPRLTPEIVANVRKLMAARGAFLEDEGFLSLTEQHHLTEDIVLALARLIDGDHS